MSYCLCVAVILLTLFLQILHEQTVLTAAIFFTLRKPESQSATQNMIISSLSTFLQTLPKFNPDLEAIHDVSNDLSSYSAGSNLLWYQDDDILQSQI